MKMRLITTKPADERFIDTYFVLTPNGKVLGKALNEYMETVVEVWETIPDHQKQSKPLR